MKNRRRTYKKRSAYRKRRQNLSRRSKGGFFGYKFFSGKTAPPVVKSNSNDDFGVSVDDIPFSERPTIDWSKEKPEEEYYSERYAESGYPPDLVEESQYPPATPIDGGGRRTRRRHRNRRGSYKRRR